MAATIQPIYFTDSVAVDGLRVAVRRTAGASEPPLVLLHCAGGSSRYWRPQLSALGRERTVYAPDFPAHGKSEPPHLESIASLAAWVDRLRATVGVERWVVCGHSMGGRVAMRYAVDFPGRTAGLIVIASGTTMRVAGATITTVRDHFEQLAAMVKRVGFSPATAESFKDDVLGPRGADCDKETLLADLATAQADDITPDLAKLDVPALIIGGRDDRLTPPELQYTLHRLIAGSRLEILDEAGHYIPNEQPERVAALLRDFTAPRTRPSDTPPSA